MKNKNTPDIRFNKYNEILNFDILNKLVEIVRGGSPRPIDSFITTDKNGLNWIKIGDAPKKGNIITSCKEKIKPNGLKFTREVFPGDLILSNSMSFGNPYIMGIYGCIHDGWLLIRDKNHCFNSNFLSYYLSSPIVKKEYKKLAAGSTVNNLNKELVGNITINFPSNKEQEKIGNYFKNIDKLIEQTQNKLNILNKNKHVLLNTFINSTDNKKYNLWQLTDWDKKFSNVESFKQTKIIKYPYALVDVFSNIEDKSGNVKLISAGNFTSTTTVEKAGKFLCKGEIIAISGGGDPSIKYCNGLFVTSDNRIMTSKNTKIVLNKFLYYWLCSKEKELSSYYRGASIKHPSMDDVLNMEIYLPKIEEQYKLVNLLTSIDNLISSYELKLSKLESIKKSLLNKMFI